MIHDYLVVSSSSKQRVVWRCSGVVSETLVVSPKGVRPNLKFLIYPMRGAAVLLHV